MNRNLELNFLPNRKRDASPQARQETITEQRYNEIKNKLNIIKTSGQEFYNVSIDDMEYVRNLGSGAFGQVTQQKFKKTKELMAVKVCFL